MCDLLFMHLQLEARLHTTPSLWGPPTFPLWHVQPHSSLAMVNDSGRLEARKGGKEKERERRIVGETRGERYTNRIREGEGER